MAPLDIRIRAMFGGYCFYIDDKVAGLVCDGRVFVKRSARDDVIEGFAELAPAYAGAKDSWRLPAEAIYDEPQRVRDLVEQIAAVLPARKKQ